MYGSGAPLSIWQDFMVNALKSTPVRDFVNPGVKVPPEPKIEQDDDKDKKKETGNQTIITDPNKKVERTEQAPSVSNEPSSKRKNMRDRVNEILGKPPVVSNKPTSN